MSRLFPRILLCALLIPAITDSAFGQDRDRGDRGRGRGPGFGFGGGPGGPPGFGGGFGGILSLAGRPEVQDAIGLTADEKEYVRLIGDGFRDAVRDAMAGLEPNERFRRGREIFEEETKKAEEQLAEAIGKDKVKRLHEIDVQLNGVRLLMNSDSDVAKKLSLNDEQQEQLREAVSEVEEELSELRRKKVEEKLMGILDGSQKSTWKELTGEPVEIKLQPRRRGDRQRGDGERGRRRGGDNN